MARILTVDDEEMERLLGRTALEGAGHQLLFAPMYLSPEPEQMLGSYNGSLSHDTTSAYPLYRINTEDA